MSDDTTHKLQASRKELLDIGLRNNLINFRKSTKNLTLVQGDTQAVFEALYVSQKSLGFGATGKAPRQSELVVAHARNSAQVLIARSRIQEQLFVEPECCISGLNSPTIKSVARLNIGFAKYL